MNLRIDHYHHIGSGSVDRKLDEILTQLGVLMSAADDMKARLDRIDVATNNLAADIRTLTSQISTAMSQADVDAVNARLETTAQALEALAAQTPDQA